MNLVTQMVPPRTTLSFSSKEAWVKMSTWRGARLSTSSEQSGRLDLALADRNGGAEGRVGPERLPASILTFSISCRSSRLRPSREQVLCAGITAVQMHFPSGAWAEVYSCQPSSGLWKRVCKGVRGQRAGTQQEFPLPILGEKGDAGKRQMPWNVLDHELSTRCM